MQVGDQIWAGRLRAVARGAYCEVRLEEPGSGELFALCPIRPGTRNVAVEAVTDRLVR